MKEDGRPKMDLGACNHKLRSHKLTSVSSKPMATTCSMCGELCCITKGHRNVCGTPAQSRFTRQHRPQTNTHKNIS